jgi:hypothetical protein
VLIHLTRRELEIETRAYEDLLADIERAIGRLTLEQRIAISRAIDAYTTEIWAEIGVGR